MSRYEIKDEYQSEADREVRLTAFATSPEGCNNLGNEKKSFNGISKLIYFKFWTILMIDIELFLY